MSLFCLAYNYDCPVVSKRSHYSLGNLPAQAMPSLFELTTIDN